MQAKKKTNKQIDRKEVAGNLGVAGVQKRMFYEREEQRS